MSVQQYSESAGAAFGAKAQDSSSGSPAQFLRSSIINFLGTLATTPLGFLVVPIMLKGFGLEQYGIWVAALSLSNLVAMAELGLSLAVTRQVASSDASGLVAIRRVYIWYAGAGALFILLSAPALSAHLHLPAALQHLAMIVFAWTAVIFPFERWFRFNLAVLEGNSRFDLVNSFNFAMAAVRTAGVACLVFTSAPLHSVAALYAATVAIGALAAQFVAAPTLARVNKSATDGASYKAVLRFAFGTQIGALAGAAGWYIVPLLIGVNNGAVEAAVYNIGQKIPLALSPLYERTAAVLLPVASCEHSRDNSQAALRLLGFALLLTVGLILPAFVLVGIFAPALLQLWLGSNNVSAVQVLRITAATLLVDAIASPFVQLFWAWGQIRQVLRVACVGLMLVSATLIPTLHWLGSVGGAVSLLIGALVATTLMVRAARELLGPDVYKVIRSTSFTLLVPVLVVSCVALGFYRFMKPATWLGLASAAGATSIFYLLSCRALWARVAISGAGNQE